MMAKSALLLGATGLIGSNLLRILLESPRYTNVTVITRKSLAINNPKLKQLLVSDFSTLTDKLYEHAYMVDDVFCCLGTTIKKARSRQRFLQVDFEYPVAAARQAHKFGARQFLVVSALGAYANSPFFYNRVKGSLEQALGEIGFSELHIFRPSLLLGTRQEFRLGEATAAFIAKVISPLLSGGLKKYRPIPASVVAMAMYQAARSEKGGLSIYDSAQIAALGL